MVVEEVERPAPAGNLLAVPDVRVGLEPPPRHVRDEPVRLLPRVDFLPWAPMAPCFPWGFIPPWELLSHNLFLAPVSGVEDCVDLPSIGPASS
eukprot:6251589-Heterocapsa_arctica.AAC.1